MIEVKVPATSANIGPGFDAFGMAFNLYNTFTFQEKNDGKLTIRGVKRRYQGKSNLVYKAMNQVYDRIGRHPKGIYIHTDIGVPVSRGLGSSATCIVAGLSAANRMSGSPLATEEIFNMAVDMEGHPDNISPAMFGGLVCSIGTHHENVFIKKEVDPGFRFFAAIPDFNLPTKEARKVLPKRIDHKDGVFNVSRATMTYLALTEGRPDVLAISMDDKLHQPYRKSMIRSYDAVCSKAQSLGAIGSCISGAGPTILCITTADKASAFKKNMGAFIHSIEPAWQFMELEPNHSGMQINEIPEDRHD